MEEKMKFTKLAAVAVAAAMLLTGCGNKAKEPAAMRVGDVDVSAGLLKAGYAGYRQMYETADEAKEKVVEECISRYEVVALAHAMGVELSDETKQDIEDYKQQFKDYYGEQEGGFEGFLAENEVTEDDFDLDIAVAYYANELMMGEMKTYFDEHYRRAKHVLISADDTNDAEAKAKAEEVLAKAKNGEDFDQLITDYGEDPGMASNPDGYYFTDGTMVQEFQDGVDSIQPGEFTLVKTDYGYHVIQRLVLDENEEAYNNAFKSAQYELSSRIGNDRFNELIDQWVEEYKIETVKNDDVINKALDEAEAAYQAALAEEEAAVAAEQENAEATETPAE